MTTQALTGERADLLQSLARSRHFLRHTTRGLTDEQAAQRTTASALCLGGLIKHVTLTERQWIRFIQDRRDSPARRARRHHPGVPGRRQVDGLRPTVRPRR